MAVIEKNKVNSLVSIIIPVYNREDLLFETLDSMIAQTYQNWECILVDDGSKKATKKAIESYISKDKRFRYMDRPINREKGANACRNYGFEISEGEYINWFDSDDIMHPEMISKKVIAFQINDTLDFVDCKIIGFRNNIFDPKNLISLSQQAGSKAGSVLDDLIYKRNWFITFGPMFKRSFLEKVELFNESIQKSQERDFFNRMFVYHTPNYLRLKDELIYYRGHDNSITSLKRNPQKKYVDEAKSYHSTFISVRSNRKFKKSYKAVFYKKQIELYWISIFLSFPELKKLTWQNQQQYFGSLIVTIYHFTISSLKFILKRLISNIIKQTRRSYISSWIES